MGYTANSELELLFDPQIIPTGHFDVLAERGLHLRPLSSTDYDRGHLSVLADLTETPDVGKERYLERFLAMKKSGSYFIIVMVDKETDQIAATGSLITEFKFVRNNGMCGHIEDITVSKQRQGQKLGFYLIQTLTELGEKIGCYKNILDCFESNQGFYEKCGYTLKGVQMAKYKKESSGKAE